MFIFHIVKPKKGNVEPEAELHHLRDLLLKDKHGVELTKETVLSESVVDGAATSHKSQVEQVKEPGTGKVIGSVKVEKETNEDNSGRKQTHSVTQVDIPSEGIHQVIPYEEDKRSPEEEKLGGEDGGEELSPLDVAEYILRTGDEESVALAVEDLLAQGILEKDEAITYLIEVKKDLELLRTAAGTPGKEEERKAELRVNIPADSERDQGLKMTTENELQEFIEKEYGELMEKLNKDESLYTELALEEVLYRAAKLLFKESLKKGNPDAQEVLYMVTQFLQNESNAGKLNPDFEKKLMEILMTALFDTLQENPGEGNLNQEVPEGRTLNPKEGKPIAAKDLPSPTNHIAKGRNE
ncbi:unnamed protein product [Darwinula stevensoni]|uniref:Uncharacterized protein n=1 Tax=Darwinula stevensoni TaxID=69355 RepID=A0A7R8X304_9CRUS|nr:unnamed protein product [Darwinula stevensoni]CAG0884486.1 unnamed protein product [Darwinula stevensoni]